jgi:hypothetical protein
VDADRDALAADRSGVWLIVAIQDLHQGTLARAVFTQDSVDLAPVDIKVNVVISQDMGEALSNATKAKGRWYPFCSGSPYRGS